jgi:polygalacturonase
MMSLLGNQQRIFNYLLKQQVLGRYVPSYLLFPPQYPEPSSGHGISIGSIASDHDVSDVTISGNTVTNSVNGLRIKTDYGATDASGKDLLSTLDFQSLTHILVT